MPHVGFGSADISPDAGMEMPGGFFRRLGKGVEDKCLAAACVVFDGSSAVALVGLDTLFIGKKTVAEARALIEKNTKVPGNNVLVCANHTHTGGPVEDCLGSTANPVYLDRVARGIASAVEEAWRAMHPAEIGAGSGIEAGIAFNRRFLMRDGREITHPGKPGTPRHAQIVAPAGPVDPEVGVLAARDAKGRVLGCVVSFGCHSTVHGGELFHPDYAHYLRKHVAARYGEHCRTVFLLGPCGDITQVDNMSTARESGPEYCEMMGMKLAAETVRTIGRMTWLQDAPVAATIEHEPCAIRNDPDVEAERPAFGLGSGPNVEKVYEQERRLVAQERARTPKLNCEVQAVRIGPLGIATNGAEYFCEYGLRIKKASPFKFTWVASLANEYIGYVPTAQAFAAGGYETRTARSSKMAPDTGQRLVEAALRALGKVAPAAG